MKIDISDTAPNQTAINMARNKACTMTTALVLGAGTPYMLHYLWGCTAEELYAWFASGAAIVTALALVVALLAALVTATGGYQVIDGHACGMVASWSKQSPTVAAYVAQVRNQKRELINKEYVALEDYYKTETAAANKTALYGKQ